MAKTFILGFKSISMDGVNLGGLVVKKEDPQHSCHDPSPSAPQIPIVTEHRKADVNLESDLGTRSFVLKLLRLVSLGCSKQHSCLIDVNTDSVKQYELRNHVQYVQDIVKLKETQKWIEKAREKREHIYLLVGFLTFLDAEVTEYERNFTSADLSMSLKVPISGEGLDVARVGGGASHGATIKSKITANGEQIIAVKYKRVKTSSSNSKDIDLAELKPGRWVEVTKRRQARPTKPNVVEAYLSESGERDDFGFDDNNAGDDEEEYLWTKGDEGGEFYL